LFVANVVNAAAAAAPAPAASDPAKRVGPFVDDQVIAVFRVDAARVDAKALEAWIVERMNEGATADGADAGRIKAAANDLAGPRGALEKYLGDFKAGGGRELYGLVRMDDVMRQQVPVLVVPIEPGTDAKKLEAVFGKQGGEKSTEVLGDVVLVGTDAQREPARAAAAQANKANGAANADLAAALASMSAAPDAPAIQIALAPSADSRKAFEQLAPTLPKEIGGGPTSDVTRGLRWATVAVALPPKPSVRVTVQARDAAAVDSLEKTIRAAIDSGVKATEAESAKVGNAGKAEMLRASAKLLPSLVPAREGNDRLVLTMDDAKLSNLASVISAGMVMARGNALRVRSMSNMRQLILACVLHANEHKGEYPDDLTAAAKAYDAAAMLKNPRGGKSGYKYVKPPLGTKSPSDRIVLYEIDTLDPDGRGVGFADGHVEFMKEPDFQKRLKDQEAAK
jgi:prepilin-type processing-associated H-X9-DG protein